MTHSSADGSGPGRRARWLSLGALAAATLAAFAGVLRAGWIFLDDPIYVTENAWVRQGLSVAGLRAMLSKPHGSNFHPLTTLSHMLDVELFGLSPEGPHAVNLALHVLTACLLATVLFGYTRAWWRSLAVATLFAIHPLRVESVAWVSERKDVLSGLFFVLVLAAYRSWTLRPTWRGRVGLFALFACGLAAKPMLVSLPFVLLLLDAWPLGRWPARLRDAWPLVVEKLPLFVLAAVSAMVTVLVQSADGAVVRLELWPLTERLGNAALSVWHYVGSSLWPTELAAYYPRVALEPVTVMVAAVALLAATATALSLRRRLPALAVGWLWFLVTLLPVLGLVQVGSQSHADRYTYLPGIGLALAVVWGVAELLERVSAPRWAGALLLLGPALALGVATSAQAALWRDTITLFGHTVRVTPPNPMAEMVLGDGNLHDGLAAQAVQHYATVLRLDPRHPDARHKLGVALAQSGALAQGLAMLEQSAHDEDIADVHSDLGYAYLLASRRDEARGELERALQLDPTHANARKHLAELEAGVASSPPATTPASAFDGSIDGLRARAVSLIREGRVAEALASYDALLAKDERDLDALNNVAWIRATHPDAAVRDGATAVRLAEKARALAGAPHPVLQSTLAAAYAETGRFADAVAAAQLAVQLARAAGATDDAARFEAQLELYRAGRPFHFAR